MNKNKVIDKLLGVIAILFVFLLYIVEGYLHVEL